MNLAYWIVAGLLALFYFYAGGVKLIRDRDQLRPMMGWVDTVPMGLVRAIGAVEVLGGVGLILPVATGIAPWLAAVAAGGLVVLQVLATALHLRRGEARLIGLNLVMIALAVTAVVLVPGRG